MFDLFGFLQLVFRAIEKAQKPVDRIVTKQQEGTEAFSLRREGKIPVLFIFQVTAVPQLSRHFGNGGRGDMECLRKILDSDRRAAFSEPAIISR